MLSYAVLASTIWGFYTKEHTIVSVVLTVAPSNVDINYKSLVFCFRLGSLNSAKIKCPMGLVSEFNVTKSDCDDGAFLEVCTDHSVLNFNFTTCGENAYEGIY